MKSGFPVTIDGLVAASRGDRPSRERLLRIADKLDAKAAATVGSAVTWKARSFVVVAACAVIAGSVVSMTSTSQHDPNAGSRSAGPQSGDVLRTTPAVPAQNRDSNPPDGNSMHETATPEMATTDVWALPSVERPAKAKREALSEDALLHLAHDALATNPRGALDFTLEHARRFPSGALAQEREVIAIDALARMGRTQEARARAAAFLAAYPSSAYRKGVSEAASPESPSPGVSQ